MSLRSAYKKPKAFCLVLVGLIIVIMAFALTLQKVRASQNFNYNIDVNYSVNANGNTSVEETYNVTNQTDTQYLDSIKVSTPSADISSVKVYYTNGANIPFETKKITQENGGYKYDYTEIKVNFNKVNAGQGLKWSFVIQYNSGNIVENKGRANVVYIPGISAENRDEYNVSLTVPTSYGQIHGFGKLPNLVSQSNSTKTFEFSKDSLNNNSIQLLFGDSTTYKGNFIYPLKNDSTSSVDYEIALPPSTASQTTFIQKMNPAPLSTRVDNDGNVLAKYRLSPGQNQEVQIDVLADVRYIQYDLANSGTIEDIPKSLKEDYTKSTKYWQADNSQIKQKSQELTSNKKSVVEKIKSINDYVIQTLNYNNEKIKYNIRQGSLEAINNPSNVVCLEYSDLTIALLRAADIPARMPVGYGYSGDLKKSSSVSDSLHSWVQAYVPNNGWINLDPTWGEKFNNFGISDIDHMTFAIWGRDDSSPFAIARAGADTNYQYENVKLSYSEVIPVAARDAKIESTNWVIFPFISFNTFQVEAPSNVTVFDALIRQIDSNSSKNIKTRSLAPSEKISGNIFNLGTDFNKYKKMALVDTSTNTDLAYTRISNNYLPMILIITIIVSVILVITMVKLLSNKRSKKINYE